MHGQPGAGSRSWRGEGKQCSLRRSRLRRLFLDRPVGHGVIQEDIVSINRLEGDLKFEETHVGFRAV
jgi:hypothetical protein